MNPAKVFEFLRLHRLPVETSVSAANRPQAAIIGYEFEIVSDTLAATRKAENLRGHPRIAPVIGASVTGDERTKPERGKLTEVYDSVYPEGWHRLLSPISA